MLTRTRLLLAAGFVTAVAAGTFLSPASVCATTGGCAIPTLAVSQYLSTTGSNITNDLAFDLSICKEQCDELANGCVGVANAAAKCALESIGADAGADERGCADAPLIAGGGGGGSGECKKGVRSGYREFQGFISSDKASALQNCAAAGDGCEADCGQSED
jgi:hypothetical protein